MTSGRSRYWGGGGVRTLLDTQKGGSEKIPGLGGGSENLQASKSTGGGGGLLTDRQTDRQTCFYLGSSTKKVHWLQFPNK